MSSCKVKNLKNTQMETPNEYLKRISPNEKYGIREHLQKERLRGVVENIMQRYAEYYHQQQLLIHSVVVNEANWCNDSCVEHCGEDMCLKPNN